MKKHTIILCLLVGLAHFAHAQVITISDSASTKPLEMVTLISETAQAYYTMH